MEEARRRQEEDADNHRMNNIRTQLNIETTAVIWGQFASETLVDMEEKGLNNMDTIMVGDILQGRTGTHITDTQRSTERYKELKNEVVKRWNDKNNTTNSGVE
jgi:hypothetical protein